MLEDHRRKSAIRPNAAALVCVAAGRYLELAARVVPGTAALRPISLLSTLAPAIPDRSLQSALEQYMHIPPHSKIIAGYSSAFAFQGGTLMRGKVHLSMC